MTYCVGMRLNSGLVFLSDSRSNAGVDHISTVRKMTVFERRGDRVLILMCAGNLAVTQAVAQLLSFLIDRGCTLEQAFTHPRVEASTTSVIVSDQAPASVVSALRARFSTEVVADTVYPVQFAVPSAVMTDAGRHTGMAHPLHPWAGVARGDAGAAAT